MIQLVKPSRGHVTQPYGNRQPDGNPHAGQDYAYTNGQEIFPEVYAAADGVVLFAGDSRGLAWPNIMYVNIDFDRTDYQDSSAGNYVIIEHRVNGVRVALTGYGHLENYSVRAGQSVKAGQRIATTGATGYSFGKHLHFDFVLAPFDVDDAPYYGRVNPNPYFVSGIAAQGTTTKYQEDTLSAAEVNQIIKAVNADGDKTRAYIGQLLSSGYTVGSQKLPGANPVNIETQRRVSIILGLVKAQAENPGAPIDLAAITAAAEEGAQNALSNLRLTNEKEAV